MEINIAREYTDKPGARYESQGAYSGEKFRDTILYPKFIESIESGETLIVNLDGGYGYGSSFLEEVFGGLVRRLKRENNSNYEKVKNIEIISNDNVSWIGKIEIYIKEATCFRVAFVYLFLRFLGDLLPDFTPISAPMGKHSSVPA